MLIGYARTSTTDQQAGFDAQLVELETYGCERTFKEQVSAVASRGELDRAIDMLREGDKLVVTKLDRLARNSPLVAPAGKQPRNRMPNQTCLQRCAGVRARGGNRLTNQVSNEEILRGSTPLCLAERLAENC